MDVQHLRYFLAVVDHGGVGAAAAALAISQPSVSQAIRSLETELGTPLFHRIGRGTVPTSAGEALIGSARRVLRGVGAVGGALADRGGSLRGRLDLMVLPALSTGVLPPLVAAFRRAHPHVSITLGKLGDDDPPGVLLRGGRCDAVVTHLPPAEGPPSNRDRDEEPLSVVGLGSQEFWITYPPDAVLAEGDTIRWEDLPDYPLVVVPPGASHAGEIVQAMADAGRLSRPAVVLQNRDARLSFVLAGVGGAFIERSLTGFARARGCQVRRFTPPLSRRFGLVTEPTSVSPAARAFVDLARSTAG